MSPPLFLQRPLSAISVALDFEGLLLPFFRVQSQHTFVRH